MASCVPERAAIEHVRELVASRVRSTVWIGIDGFGRAGKSTFAMRLAEALTGSVVVHIDDFSGPHVREWDWERFVSQVMEIGPPADSVEPTRNLIFRPGPDGRATPEGGHISAALLDDLVAQGFDPELLEVRSEAWL